MLSFYLPYKCACRKKQVEKGTTEEEIGNDETKDFYYEILNSLNRAHLELYS